MINKSEETGKRYKYYICPKNHLIAGTSENIEKDILDDLQDPYVLPRASGMYCNDCGRAYTMDVLKEMS